LLELISSLFQRFILEMSSTSVVLRDNNKRQKTSSLATGRALIFNTAKDVGPAQIRAAFAVGEIFSFTLGFAWDATADCLNWVCKISGDARFGSRRLENLKKLANTIEAVKRPHVCICADGCCTHTCITIFYLCISGNCTFAE